MYTLLQNTPHFIVIDKHAGVDFHRGSAAIGLVDVIRHDLRVPDLLPVHRLDSMTSGILLFAKGRKAAADISLLFRRHEIQKYYIAVAGNQPKKKQGLITGDMIKGRDGQWILSRTNKNPAVTQFFSAGLGNGLRLYLLKPSTGKTHQLRVALKAISVPVLGDHLYAKGYYKEFETERGYLHAFMIRFYLYEKEYSFRCDPTQGRYFLGDSFNAVLGKFSEPWTLPWPKLKPGILPQMHTDTGSDGG